jgi:hypothetical protein
MVYDIIKDTKDSTYDPGCYQCRMETHARPAGVPPTTLCVGHIIKRLRIAEGTEQQVQADSPDGPTA